MLETSMIKLFASDSLWRIVNDTLQIHGGAGFFTDRPFERLMRDARLNLIGEGANDVLRCFNAMVGLRNLGKELQEVMKKPWRAVYFGARRRESLCSTVSCKSRPARWHGRLLASPAPARGPWFVTAKESSITSSFKRGWVTRRPNCFMQAASMSRLSGLLTKSQPDESCAAAGAANWPVLPAYGLPPQCGAPGGHTTTTTKISTRRPKRGLRKA